MWIQLPELGQTLSSSRSGISVTAHLLLQRPWNGPVALLLSSPPTAVTAPGPAGSGTQQSQPCPNIKEEVSFFNQTSPLMQGQEGRSDKMRDSWQVSAAGAQ